MASAWGRSDAPPRAAGPRQGSNARAQARVVHSPPVVHARSRHAPTLLFAVVYYRVLDPVRVVVGVQNYQAAIAQVAQASLRSMSDGK